MVSTLSQAKMLFFSAPHSAQHSPFSEPQRQLPLWLMPITLSLPQRTRKSKFNWYIRTSIRATKKTTLLVTLSHFFVPSYSHWVLLRNRNPYNICLYNKIILGEKTLSIKIFKAKFHLQKKWPFQPKSLSPHLPGIRHHRTEWQFESGRWCQPGDRAQALMLSLLSGPQSHHPHSDKTEPRSSIVSFNSKVSWFSDICKTICSSSQSKLRRKII